MNFFLFTKFGAPNKNKRVIVTFEVRHYTHLVVHSGSRQEGLACGSRWVEGMGMECKCDSAWV